MIKKKSKILILFFSIFLMLVSAAESSAQNQVALQISPLKTFVSLESEAKIQKSVYLTNLSEQTLKIKPRVVGFDTAGDQGALKILEGDFKNYVNLPISLFEMEPGQKREVKYIVSAPKDSVGGKYFAILFTTEAIEDGAGAFLSGEVGNLIFLEILGTAEKRMQIENFKVKKFYWGEPEFFLTLKNSGNVHIQPYGEIVIENWLDRRKDLIPFYFPSVLPGKKRTLDFQSPRNLFGKYTAMVNVVSDGNLIIEKKSFWAFSAGPLIIIFCAAIILIFSIKFFIKRKNP